MTNEQQLIEILLKPQVIILISFLVILALGCIGFIILHISRFIKKNGIELEHGKTKVKINGTENPAQIIKEEKKEEKITESVPTSPVNINVNVNNTNTVEEKTEQQSDNNEETTIQMSSNTFSLLMDTIEQVYNIFISKRDTINNRSSMQQIKIQKDSVMSAISNLHVLYTQEDASFSSDKADTLSLFLTRDFTDIINKEILDLITINDLNTADEEFINEQVTNISSLCLTKMKSVIFNYPFIDSVLMRSVLDRESHVIKNMVSMIVKQLSSVTKEQQQKILILQKEKLDDLKSKLQNYITVEE
jgi:hypothetical protein